MLKKHWKISWRKKPKRNIRTDQRWSQFNVSEIRESIERSLQKFMVLGLWKTDIAGCVDHVKPHVHRTSATGNTVYKSNYGGHYGRDRRSLWNQLLLPNEYIKVKMSLNCLMAEVMTFNSFKATIFKSWYNIYFCISRRKWKTLESGSPWKWFYAKWNQVSTYKFS